VDRRSRAPPHGLSQLATSFIACPRLGILRAPLLRLASSSSRPDRPTSNTPNALALLPIPTLSNSPRPARNASRRSWKSRFWWFERTTLSAFDPKVYSPLQKGGDPAAGSPTATLLRLRPSYRACLRPLPPCGWDTDFGHSRLPWRDGRCVQGPGTYSPRRS
jgi:hypothetical protein